MSQRQAKSTITPGPWCLSVVAMLALGATGCSISLKQLPVNSRPANGPTETPHAPTAAEPLEDPETNAAFNELLIARSSFKSSSGIASVNPETPSTNLADRMSQDQRLEVVDYPSLDTIFEAGGWSPASNQFVGCDAVLTGSDSN